MLAAAWLPSLGETIGEEDSVRYGVSVPNFGVGVDARAIAELAREAEEAGWDGAFPMKIAVPRYQSSYAGVAGPSTPSGLELVGLYDALEGDLFDPRPLRVLCHKLLSWFWLLEGAYDEPGPTQCPEVPR